MELRRFSRRIRRAVVACAAGSVGLLAFAGAAHADSSLSVVRPNSCISGSANSLVNLSYTTTASFTTGVRVHVVSDTPDGPIIDTVFVPLQGPTTATIPFNLSEGTYYFDWEDRNGDGVTFSGRHSTISDFYNGIYLATKTIVGPCEATTTTAATTTTDSTTTTATTTPGGVGPQTPENGPTITNAGTPVTTIPTTFTTTTSGGTTSVIPPTLPSVPASTTVPPSTTGPVRSTSVSVPTTPPDTGGLVVAGASTAPLLGLGAAFLGAGAGLTVLARSRLRRSGAAS